MPLLKMTSDILPFSALPTELTVEVLMELPDLHSIHSLRRASRRVYDIYQDPQLQLRIIRSLILRTGDFRGEANIYSLLQILKCIIKERMIKRDVALSILQDGWKLFAENGYEQLLIPFQWFWHGHTPPTNANRKLFVFSQRL